MAVTVGVPFSTRPAGSQRARTAFQKVVPGLKKPAMVPKVEAPPPDPRKEEEEFPPSLADGADVPPDPNDRKRRAPEALEAKITKLTIRDAPEEHADVADAPEEHADVAERVFEFVGCRIYDGGYCEGECVESPHRWCSGWKRRSIEA